MNTPAKSISDKTSKHKAEIEFVNKQRLHKLDRKHIVQFGQAVLARIDRGACAATITFIRDAAMRQLNRDYRQIDQPTDVLAFAYHEGMSDNEPDHNADFLGDVVISVETAARYAREQNISFETEINWLVIHGLLHLAGYDHETDEGEMRRLERRLRKELESL
ncbi:MAG TPA: rRNA maturation RNase YbeY [Blastocatellia bacterium]|nr:rRNA maturation RNase YbeY [Blastocatellia bacterium]